MAVEKKKGKGTPGRPRKTGNQFFEVGKVGRKTGITLEDKGIRDEHGLEPVSHIFSSPAASPQRNGDKTLSSSDMLVQQSSAPDVDATLHSRKTPRLPPPRASTPKHTNIGSPKRMSTGRPISQRLSVDLLADGSPARPKTLPANRVLDFGAPDTVHKSIEAASPFKPKRNLRRSVGPGVPALAQPFASPKQDSKIVSEVEEPSQDEVEADEVVQAGAEEDAKPADDGPLMLDEDDYYDAIPQQPSPIEEEPEHVDPPQSTPAKRKPGRPRKSGDSINNSQVSHSSPAQSRKPGRPRKSGESINDSQTLHSSPAQSRKRTRTSFEEGEASSTQLQSEATAPSQKKRRSRLSKDKSVIVHQDDGDAAIDPSLLAYGDQYVDEVEVIDDEAAEAEDEVPELPTKGKGKGKGKAKAPKERDANRRMKSSSVQLNDSPSKYRNSQAPSRGGSVGPVSNVHLRATTPFEDANGRTSRYGRNLMQPLKYWANEGRVWNHGTLEGIIRADDVEVPKKKAKRKTRKRKGISKLVDADEESETESVLPDEWEEDVGVIAGQIATWDPETQMGDSENLIREDLAFASSAIVTRDDVNSEFKYAKIMTLPFFGSGVVELPPEGFKRAKNSRKMQMCFFVHEGKVMVEVGAANGTEPNEFAVSKGGAWVVPRGNNYAISNESRTKTARVFFAQGCEMDAGAVE